MKNKWLCLPKQKYASTCYGATKMLLLTFFLMVIIVNIAWTVICMRTYRQKVVDLKATRWPSRSEIQYYTTHSNFFLFSGIMSASIFTVGLWGILMEYLVVLAAFSYMCGVCFGFEVIGAILSGDSEVQLYKAFGVAPEPLMLVLGLVFAHMIRVCERKLAEDPQYKKKMAEMKSKGETGTNFNTVKKDSFDSNASTDANGNRPSKTGSHNLALDIDDEIKKSPRDAGVHDTQPRSSTASASLSSGSGNHDDGQSQPANDTMKDKDTVVTADAKVFGQGKVTTTAQINTGQQHEFIDIELREGS
ncbi:hypothetical protein HDE_05005 [Halotydeus destructor]|nr:hypothetical protein HDE_05005 [Halotydeus destructor]